MDEITDPELLQMFAAQAADGQFASAAAAKADFVAKIAEGLDDIRAGRVHDLEDVRASLHARYANWPRAAG